MMECIHKVLTFLSLCVIVSCKYTFHKGNTEQEQLYPVLLDHCGPEPKEAPPIHKPHVITETHHEPLQILPYTPIPPPKVLSHKVYHVQTVLRPKVYQRVITVPRILRFLKKEVKPVVEHIPYVAKPVLPQVESPAPIIGLNSALQCPPSPMETPKNHLPPLNSALQFPPSPMETPKNHLPPLNAYATLPKDVISWKDLFPTPYFSHSNNILKKPLGRHHTVLPKSSLNLPTLL